MHIEFRRSAFRHGISEERQRHVINYCPVPLYQSAESPADADVLIFLGPDQNGVPLEVAAVDLADGGLRVIPAMRMRDKYQADYERVMKWQG